MQHRLKASAGAAGAGVVAAELLDQLLAPDRAVAALDVLLATGTPGAACSSAQKLTWSSCLLTVLPPRVESTVDVPGANGPGFPSTGAGGSLWLRRECASTNRAGTRSCVAAMRFPWRTAIATTYGEPGG